MWYFVVCLALLSANLRAGEGIAANTITELETVVSQIRQRIRDTNRAIQEVGATINATRQEAQRLAAQLPQLQDYEIATEQESLDSIYAAQQEIALAALHIEKCFNDELVATQKLLEAEKALLACLYVRGIIHALQS